jgi:drug/metabolite transporter (DMT)-like permease
MRGLKVMLLINLISGGMYTLLLLLLPRQLVGILMAPQEIAWARYLVPIYLALTFASWHAYRKPRENVTVIQTLLVMWVGLVLTHLVNAAFGDEQLMMTAPLLVFDAIMAAGLAYFYFQGEKVTKKHETVNTNTVTS